MNNYIDDTLRTNKYVFTFINNDFYEPHIRNNIFTIIIFT